MVSVVFLEIKKGSFNLNCLWHGHFLVMANLNSCENFICSALGGGGLNSIWIVYFEENFNGFADPIKIEDHRLNKN